MTDTEKIVLLLQNKEWEFVNQGLELLDLLATSDPSIIATVSSGMEITNGVISTLPSALQRAVHQSLAMPKIIALLAREDSSLVAALQEVDVGASDHIPEDLLRLPNLRIIDIRQAPIIKNTDLPVRGLRIQQNQLQYSFPELRHLEMTDASISLTQALTMYPKLSSISVHRLWGIDLSTVTDLSQISADNFAIDLRPQTGGLSLAQRATSLMASYSVVKNHIDKLPNLRHLNLLSHPPELLSFLKNLPHLESFTVNSELDTLLNQSISTEAQTAKFRYNKYRGFAGLDLIEKDRAQISKGINDLILQRFAERWKKADPEMRSLKALHLFSSADESSLSSDVIEWFTDFTIQDNVVIWTLAVHGPHSYRISQPKIMSVINEYRGKSLASKVDLDVLCQHKVVGNDVIFDLTEENQDLSRYSVVRQVRMRYLLERYIPRIRYSSHTPIVAPKDTKHAKLPKWAFRALILGIAKCPSLERLDVEDCCSDSQDALLLEQAISKAKNLRWLEIGHNQLKSLPESIGALSKLEGLFVYGNHLTSLPESFTQLDSLQVISLSMNHFTSIPFCLWELPMLETIYCKGYAPTEHERAQAQSRGIALRV